MSAPHLEKRWINAEGELSRDPQTRISLTEDIENGLEKFARVFRPGKISKLSIRLEGWENDISVRWGWQWDPSAFVGGVAYRYAFNGEWSSWEVDHSYGFSPGSRPSSDGLGIRMKIKRYGVLFEVEVALLGLCGMSRGPITKLAGRIPLKEDIPDRQPALLLNEMVNFD